MAVYDCCGDSKITSDSYWQIYSVVSGYFSDCSEWLQLQTGKEGLVFLVASFAAFLSYQWILKKKQ